MLPFRRRQHIGWQQIVTYRLSVCCWQSVADKTLEPANREGERSVGLSETERFVPRKWPWPPAIIYKFGRLSFGAPPSKFGNAKKWAAEQKLGNGGRPALEASQDLGFGCAVGTNRKSKTQMQTKTKTVARLAYQPAGWLASILMNAMR